MQGGLERYREIIPEFSGFRESLKRPRLTHIRLNALKADVGDTRSALERKGVLLEQALMGDGTCFYAPGLDFPGRLLEYELGHLHAQAFTSCLVSLVLQVPEGSCLLDLCASPGGKCSHAAQLMRNSGLIVANELYRDRHSALGHTLDRLGVLNTVLTSYPAQEYPLKMRFDRVLADVPCTGEGRLPSAREPSWKPGASHQIERLVNLQKRIILRAFDLLRPEGILVYSTCTYNPDENEGVVDYLLKSRPARLTPLEVHVPMDPGITKWRDVTYDIEVQKAARFYPHRVHSVGFFMARIGRGD
jgi:NOL1/NOP2/sun family putative RNA methylase